MHKRQHFDDVDVVSGNLSLSDTSLFFDRPFVLPVVPGRYRVAVVASLDDPSDSAVDILRDGEGPVRPGRIYRRELSIEFGQLGICDRVIAAALFPIERYHDLLDGVARPRGTVRLETGEVMLVTFPRVGNARFNVVALERADGTCVGAEVDLTDWIDDEGCDVGDAPSDD